MVSFEFGKEIEKSSWGLRIFFFVPRSCQDGKTSFSISFWYTTLINHVYCVHFYDNFPPLLPFSLCFEHCVRLPHFIKDVKNPFTKKESRVQTQ